MNAMDGPLLLLSDPARLLLALAAAGVLALGLGPLLIPALRLLKVGQAIRAEGPERHKGKAGTPTMGGVIFLLPAAATTLIFAPRGGAGWTMVLLALVVTLGNGLIGFLDDFVKVARKRSLGLRAREKLAGQTALALALAYVAAVTLDLGTMVTVPYSGWQIDLGVLYYPFVVIVVLGSSNAVNLTDGLDGLLGGAAVIAFAFYAFVALALGRTGLAVFCAALAGAVGGFMRYNAYPARVFMGDVGSLALGGSLAALAVLTKTELLLPVVGGLFVIETLSVIIQVTSFRLTGRRIFRMSPLHHHFELAGWPETTVVRRFWLVALVFAAVAWFGLPGLVR